MKMDPFIEAEEAAGHSVCRCCELFEVSRPPTTSARRPCPRPGTSPTPSSSRRSRPSTPSPKAPTGSCGCTRLWPGRGCGRRRVRRLMRQAGLEGRAKKRWRKTTVADPEAEAAKDLIQRHFGPCAEIDRRYVGDITYLAPGRAGPTWPPSSTWPAAA